jgi:hypothetical protein
MVFDANVCSLLEEAPISERPAFTERSSEAGSQRDVCGWIASIRRTSSSTFAQFIGQALGGSGRLPAFRRTVGGGEIAAISGWTGNRARMFACDSRRTGIQYTRN